MASVSPHQERAGGRGQPSPRQRPCFSQNSRAIYAPCCPHEEWAPLFLSPGWYFNGRLTGNRAKGAICPFFPLKRLQKCTLAGAVRFSLKATPVGPVTKPRDLTPNTFPQPLSALSAAFILSVMPGTSQQCQKCCVQVQPNFMQTQCPLMAIKSVSIHSSPNFLLQQHQIQGQADRAACTWGVPLRAKWGSLKSFFFLSSPFAQQHPCPPGSEPVPHIPVPVCDVLAWGWLAAAAQIIIWAGLTWQLPKWGEDEAWAIHFL